ncbi:hypothetical protein Clacol_002114 [Clathrus columnatus]|uniref:DUF4100 domain-containing protein n=1 Tax=Clathrus columnatus TaxID=1419009 RepID=A0AAV5A345_9AGAM|nr:hypothetical protein Clacol_002114 [Clathrus columnatus]
MIKFCGWFPRYANISHPPFIIKLTVDTFNKATAPKIPAPTRRQSDRLQGRQPTHLPIPNTRPYKKQTKQPSPPGSYPTTPTTAPSTTSTPITSTSKLTLKSERQDDPLDDSILTDLSLDNQDKGETTGSDSFPLSTPSGSAQSSIADSELDRIVKETEEFLERTTYISPPSPKSTFITPSIPIFQPSMSASPPPSSVSIIRTHMPLPGSPQAPKTFAGNKDKIADFLEHFELCANESQLPESEKVTWLLRFLTKERKEIFKTYDGCEEKDWTTFITAIKTEYAEAFKLKLVNSETITKYFKKNSLTTEDKDTCFWFGLHETTRALIKSELCVTHPSNPTDKPYASADVLSISLCVFATNAFDSNPPPELATSEKESVGDQEYAATYSQVESKLRSLNMNITTTMQPLEAAKASTMSCSPSGPCNFCKDLKNLHWMKNCPVAIEYLKLGKVTISTTGGYYWRLPNGGHIPGHPQGLKHSVDEFCSMQKNEPTTMKSSYIFTVETIEDCDSKPGTGLAFIKEVTPSVVDNLAAKNSQTIPSLPPNPPITSYDKKAPQYQYHSKMEDSTMAQTVFDKIMDNPITLPTCELITISPDLQKLFIDTCRVNKIPVFSTPTKSSAIATAHSIVTSVALRTAPIREFDLYVQGKHLESGIYDPGAELVCISEQAAKELGLAFSTDYQLSMKDANGGIKDTFGIIENLELMISGKSLFVQAWIVRNAPY